MIDLHELANTIRRELTLEALTEAERCNLTTKFLLALEKNLPGWRKQCDADSLLCRELSHNMEQIADRLDSLEAIVDVILHSPQRETRP